MNFDLYTYMYLEWRPGRTVVLCSWDAEEYGLIGSTEWVEVSYTLLHFEPRMTFALLLVRTLGSC